MSEIVCKLSVNVWISDRPVITWWPVTRSSRDGVRYAAAVNEKGTVRTLERPVPFKRMERVKCIRPGVMEYWWVQPDDQRIDGGVAVPAGSGGHDEPHRGRHAAGRREDPGDQGRAVRER